MLTDRHPYFFTPRHPELEAPPRAFRCTGSIRERVAALAAAGLLDGPLDVRGLAVIRSELAYTDALTDLAFIVQELGTFPLVQAGGFETEVAEARAGRSVIAFALTEPDAG